MSPEYEMIFKALKHIVDLANSNREELKTGLDNQAKILAKISQTIFEATVKVQRDQVNEIIDNAIKNTEYLGKCIEHTASLITRR